MNIEPQKFFIGLMDFFSILLPGAFLSWLLMINDVAHKVIGARYEKLSGAEAWITFLFASYLLGHLVFLLGSWLDELYDYARNYTLNTQIKRLAYNKELLPWPFRALIWLVFKGERNLAVDRAGRIKQKVLGPLQAKESINTFQWCKALLTIESPESLSVVHRFEADSKFFRSFTVVMLAYMLLPYMPLLWCSQQWPFKGRLMALLVFPLALWRFMEQRYKATNQAYWAVITLTAKNDKFILDNNAPVTVNPTYAGGVVFRIRFGSPEYLLVEVKNDTSQWVLPKGLVEQGEGHRDTAVRKVHDEAGVWGRIIAELSDVSWIVGQNVITTRFFLMQAVGRGVRKDKARRHEWLEYKCAIARASYAETRSLLEAAELQRTRTSGRKG